MDHPTSQTLYTELLAKRQRTQKFDHQEIRLSEVGHCLRAAALRILGFAAEPTTLQQESVFQSGDEHEEHIAALWEAAYPGGIDRQVEVRSPFGTGHMDIWVTPIRHYVEAKSTKLKSVKYLPLQEHVEQTTMYHHYYIQPTGGGTAEIAYRVKETGEILSFPVVYSQKKAEELVKRLEGLQESVTVGVPLPIPRENVPDRFPCGWNDADGNFVTCGFWRHCWMAETGEDPAAAPLIERFAKADQVYRRAKERLEKVKAARQQVGDAAKVLMQARDARSLRSGTQELRWTVYSGYHEYDVKAAIDDGVVSAESVAPYRRWRNGREDFRIADYRAKASGRRKPKAKGEDAGEGSGADGRDSAADG